MKGKYAGAIPLLLTLILIPILFLGAAGFIENRVKGESLDMAEKNIRRAAVQCYALEGTYPQDISYLEEHYGVSVDTDRFRVDYIFIASNLMPDVTVVALGGG